MLKMVAIVMQILTFLVKCVRYLSRACSNFCAKIFLIIIMMMMTMMIIIIIIISKLW